MDSLKDLLLKKADQVDISAKKTELQLLQDVVDRHFGGRVQVQKLHEGRLTLKVNSSSLASDVRFSQVRLLDEFQRLKLAKIERLIIRH